MQKNSLMDWYSYRLILPMFIVVCIISSSEVIASTGIYGVSLENGQVNYLSKVTRTGASQGGNCLPTGANAEYSFGTGTTNTKETTIFNASGGEKCTDSDSTGSSSTYGIASQPLRCASCQYPSSRNYHNCSPVDTVVFAVGKEMSDATTYFNPPFSDPFSDAAQARGAYDYIADVCTGIPSPYEQIASNREYSSSHTLKFDCKGGKHLQSIVITGTEAPAMQINSVSPTSSNRESRWEIPANETCGSLITLTPTTSDSMIAYSETKSIYGYYVCTLAINSFSVSKSSVDPYFGETVQFNAVFSDEANWTLVIGSKTFSGSGASLFETWNGRGDDGQIVPAGTYNATLTITTKDNDCAVTRTVSVTVPPPCDVKISNFMTTKSSIDPVAGEATTFKADITSSRDFSWTLIIGSTATSGTGALSHTWDGKDFLGRFVSNGTYTAYLNAASTDGKCSDSGQASVEVKKGPTQCNEESGFESTVNVTSGRLSHNQELLALKGGALPAAISLFYDSLAPQTGPIDTDLIHHFQKALLVQGDGSIVFREWDRSRAYTVTETGYLAPDGDGSTLVKNTDGTYQQTEVDGTVNSFDQTGKIVSTAEDNGDRYGFAYGSDTVSVTDPHNVTTTFSQLYYNSINPSAATMSHGWSHSYEIALQDQGNGAVLFRDGPSSRLYVRVGDVYQSPAGDRSTFVKNTDGTYVVTEQNGLKHTFDQWGRIVSRSDGNGSTKSFNYTGGNLSTLVDGSGRATSFAYDPNGKLLSITDPKGNSYTFSYESGNLTVVTHPDGGQWRYTYDNDGFLLSKTDPEGNLTTYTYDANHRVLTGTDPQGETRSLVYNDDVSANSTKNSVFTEKDGGNWTYTYDTATGTLTSKTDPLGNSISYTYDEKKNVQFKTEPRIGTTSYLYDADNKLTQMINPLHQATQYTYNSRGQVLTVIAPDGGTTTNTYDDKGNLTSVTDAAGATTTYGYDSRGNLSTVTNAKSQATEYAYNTAGYLASIVDPTGAVTSFTYDANGNLLTRTNDSGKTTSYVYDGMNRLAKVTDPLGNETSYGYDRLGNRTSVTDANGNTTTYRYNYRGQMIESRDPQGHVTTYYYGATGCPSCGGGADKLTALTDANMQTTTFQYDQLGRLTLERDPLGKEVRYSYSPDVNEVTVRDPNGTYVSQSYDPLNRLTQKMYEGYTYDAGGRILTAAFRQIGNTINYTYLYDTAGRVIKVTDSRGYVIAYEYDVLGNRTKMTLQPGTVDERVTTYTYDVDNRLTSITSSSGTFGFTYDNLGRRTSLSYPNQIVATYTYDDADRLTSVIHGTAGNGAIASFGYTHDRVGNRLSRTNGEAEQYIYDVTYRLLSVVTGRQEAFSFDAVGNRQHGPGAKDGSYQYDAVNRMLQGRKLQYQYDNNGNQTIRTVAKARNATWTQSWDYANRLIRMEKATGTEKRVVSFKYDPFGRRIEKKVVVTDDGMTTTETFSYVYDNDNVVLEIYSGSTGMTKTFYTHGLNVDEHLAMERGGHSYFYHADGLGSITAITDATAQKVQSYSYDPYGMVTPRESFQNSYAYTGREWDKETGLYYYRARYYDPMEGRFVSKDPIGHSGGDVNLYNYVGSNPINFKDPSGKSMIGDVYDWIKWGADAAVVHKIAKKIAEDEDKAIDALLKGHCGEAQIYRDEAIALRKIYDELINKLAHNPPPGTIMSNPGSSGR